MKKILIVEDDTLFYKNKAVLEDKVQRYKSGFVS